MILRDLSGALMVSLALLLSTSMSLQQFESSWTLEVTATVPSSYSLQSLKINILRGSVESDVDLGMSVNNFEAELCGSGSNQVSLDGFSFTESASICASDDVKLNSITLSGTSLEVMSVGGSSTVFIHVSIMTQIFFDR
jgi:hypothetical protein